MQHLLKYICLCLVCILPLTTQANPAGTVIFEHPENGRSELWITDLANTSNARLVFKHTRTIWKSAVQKDGFLIVIVADNNDEPFFLT